MLKSAYYSGGAIAFKNPFWYILKMKIAISGKGGVGKSTISAALSLLFLSEPGEDILRELGIAMVPLLRSLA